MTETCNNLLELLPELLLEILSPNRMCFRGYSHRIATGFVLRQVCRRFYQYVETMQKMHSEILVYPRLVAIRDYDSADPPMLWYDHGGMIRELAALRLFHSNVLFDTESRLYLGNGSKIRGWASLKVYNECGLITTNLMDDGQLALLESKMPYKAWKRVCILSGLCSINPPPLVRIRSILSNAHPSEYWGILAIAIQFDVASILFSDSFWQPGLSLFQQVHQTVLSIDGAMNTTLWATLCRIFSHCAVHCFDGFWDWMLQRLLDRGDRFRMIQEARTLADSMARNPKLEFPKLYANDSLDANHHKRKLAAEAPPFNDDVWPQKQENTTD